MKKIMKNLINKWKRISPLWLKYLILAAVILTTVGLLLLIVKAISKTIAKLSNPLKGKLFKLKTKDSETEKKGSGRNTKVSDRKKDRAEGKEAAKFIKHPEKFNSRGVKRPAADQKRIRKYMKANGGNLPPDVEAELNEV